MNQAVKEKWLDALKSDKYTQGYGYLIQKTPATGKLQHCCLGVLCDISGIVEVEEENGFLDYTGKCGPDGYLPQAVREWAGITINEERRLVDMNDSRDRADAGNDGWSPNGYQNVISKIERL